MGRIDSQLKRAHQEHSTYEQHFFFGYTALIQELGFNFPSAAILTKLDRYLRYNTEKQINFAWGRIWVKISVRRLAKEIPALHRSTVSRRMKWLCTTSPLPSKAPALLRAKGENKQVAWISFSNDLLEVTQHICEYSELYFRFIHPQTREERIEFEPIALQGLTMISFPTAHPSHIAPQEEEHLSEDPQKKVAEPIPLWNKRFARASAFNTGGVAQQLG